MLAFTKDESKIKPLLIDNYFVLDIGKKNNIRNALRQINTRKFLSFGTYEIEAAYPNYIYELVSTDDPIANDQYALTNLNAEEAWQKNLGEGSVVAVIDSGIDYTHEDLKNNIWINEAEIPDNGIDDDNNGFIDDIRGYDFIEEALFSCNQKEDCDTRDNDPFDISGHGTHVSGIIAAEQNNGIGISGIAPKAKIMPLKVAFSVSGLAGSVVVSDVIDAIIYAKNNGADIINLSLAGPQLIVLENAINEAHEAGVLVIAAAGNRSSSEETFPAAFENVLSVGAVNEANGKAPFSNFGSWVNLAAPGNAILSTLPGNKYEFLSGTSQAAPYVAGVAALINGKDKLNRLTNEDIKNRILNSGQSSDFDFRDENFRLISLKALNAAINFPLEVDQMELPSKARKKKKVTFIGSGSDSDSEIIGYEWTSNKDGLLSEKASFSTRKLSKGKHRISLRVKNELQEFSEPVIKEIKIKKRRKN